MDIVMFGLMTVVFAAAIATSALIWKEAKED